MIIFCPVKSEKWIRDVKDENGVLSNRADEVTNKVRNTYRNLINAFAKYKGISMWVMPVQTVGAIEFAEMKEAKRYFKDSSDKEGTQCSYDELTGIVRLKDGRIISDAEESDIELDDTVKRGLVDVPLAWYKRNELTEFSPVFCEQPAFHIMRFLVQKQLAVDEKKKKDRDKKMRWLRLLGEIFGTPFGKHIEKYREVITTLENNNQIKESGHGFVEIREKIM